MSSCLLITTSYPTGGLPGSESAGAFVEDFAVSLSRHVALRVIAPALQAGIEERDNLRVNYFKVPRIPLSLLKPSKPLDWFAIAQALRSGDATVADEIARDPPSHIMALWVLPSGYWARRQGAHAKIPYSTWALGSDIWTLGRIPVVRNVLRTTLKSAAFCYADGEQLRADVKRLAGRDCDFLASSRLLPCPSRLNPATRPPYKLAFLGRWHPNKGADILLDSLRKLDDQDWQCIEEIRIAGGGPQEALVMAGVRELRAAGRPVVLQGFLGREAAIELLTWADWLLVPSRIESIPVIFSDGLQAGCAMLTTPAGDLAQIVEGFGVGLCADAANSDAFGAVLKRGLAMSPAQFQCGIRAAAQRFSVAESARRFALDAGFIPVESRNE